MNKYVKIKYNNKVLPNYYLYVDKDYVWDEESIIVENNKAVEIAKMAFLDHGSPLIPADSLDDVSKTTAAYTLPKRTHTLLITEGGLYMTLVPDMEILEERLSEFYPISSGEAIVCENDPMDKWNGNLDHLFLAMAKRGGAEGFHYMFNFRNRPEVEIVHAFKNTPAILFNSSHTEVDWWQLMLRCIFHSNTKAKIIGRRPDPKWGGGYATERFDKCLTMAKGFGIDIDVFT